MTVSDILFKCLLWTFSTFLWSAKLRSHVLAMRTDRELTKALEINGSKCAP